MKQQNLKSPASVDLSGASSPSEMAKLEGWSTEDYAIGLADAIRLNRVPLSNQVERLQTLAKAGAAADRAAADTLAQHHQVLEALFSRFAVESVQWLDSGKPGASRISERYLSAAIKAQAAAVRVLSALKALRDAPSPALGTPTTAAVQAEVAPAPAAEAGAFSGVLLPQGN